MTETQQRRQYQMRVEGTGASKDAASCLFRMNALFDALPGEGDHTWFIVFCDAATHDALVELGYALVLDEDSLSQPGTFSARFPEYNAQAFTAMAEGPIPTETTFCTWGWANAIERTFVRHTNMPDETL